MLRLGLLASGITAYQSTPTALLAGEAVTRDASMAAAAVGEITNAHTGDLAKTAKAEWPEEIDELVLFGQRLKKANAEAGHKTHTGIATPYATMPISVYMRLTEEQLAIPEPQIPRYHYYTANYQCVDLLDWLAQTLAERLKLIRPAINVVDEITLLDLIEQPVPRDRVVSPRYIVDMDEPMFGMRTTAVMLLDAVAGIWHAWDAKIKTVLQTLRTQGGVRSLQCQVTPIKIYCTREAYMLEVFAYNIGAGFATSKHKR